MRRSKFVPITLENVGSEGKFFTDKTVLKLFGVFILSVFLFLIASQIVGILLPLIPSLVLGSVFGIYSFTFISRHLVLKEKQLKGLMYKITGRDSTPTGEFSDVYYVDKNNICYHDSGHISAYVRVERGSTIGMSHKAVDQYYTSFESFENSILRNGYSYKYYDIQYSEKDFEYLDIQKRRLSRTQIPGLKKNMTIRNKYIRDFTRIGGRYTMNVYVIYTTRTDLETFVAKINQSLTNLPLDNHIVGRYIMDESGINNFGKLYFNVPYYQLIGREEQENKRDILKFKE